MCFNFFLYIYKSKIFISYQGLWNLNRHLQKKLSDATLTELFAFINLALVSKARMGETTKENRSRMIVNRLIHAKRANYIFIPYNPE